MQKSEFLRTYPKSRSINPLLDWTFTY